jgi:hypothetical protein
MLSLDSPDAPQPLVERPGRQHGAVFSPNGRWVAYGSNEETPQADQIYVQPFPPTGEIYQITQESGAFPVWSPDGSALSYRRGAQGTGGETAPALFEVQIVGDERFAWRDERRLPFEGFLVFGGVRDYDVLPDGQGFVVILSPESAGPTERQRIDVVLNWVEELTSRLPDD